jgi:NTP pyrophosphatase (non-canonical NTP hydrolase)
MAEHAKLRAANVARQAEWTKGDPVSALFRATELAGEVGEACNVVKKIERERRGWAGSRATVSELAEEIADIVICADLLAMAEGIDLDAAVVAKFNATSEKVGLATRLAAADAERDEALGIERCDICAEVLNDGDLVLADDSLGTVHAACCGPDREGYTLNGEALGPDDPIPAGDAYERDTPERRIAALRARVEAAEARLAEAEAANQRLIRLGRAVERERDEALADLRVTKGEG